MDNCPCGENKSFANCCELFISGLAQAESPEKLMRSRYSAYCEKNAEYLEKTTDPQTRAKSDFIEMRRWMDSVSFVKLEVLRSSEEGLKGVVEFKAHFKGADGVSSCHHEISKFRKQGGAWYFRDGKVIPT